MNERELRDRIFALAGRRPPTGNGEQVPFVEAVLEIHPDGYEGARAAAAEAIVGPADKIYRPALGAPHVDIYRYPPTAERRFWCYLSNGMSDLPQIRPDGSTRRSEILACTREKSVLAVDLVHRVALDPFCRGRAIETEAMALDGAAITGFGHLMVAPDGALPALRGLDLEEPALRIEIFSITSLSVDEFEYLETHQAEQVVAEIGGDPLFWILDERFGLEPPSDEEEPSAESVVRGSACLEEATASPCPKCGGSLRERRLDDETDPFLVCRACGWSRADSALGHVAPYRWALDRLRRELGDEVVDWDVRPDGDGVVLRVNAPGRPPALVELKNPGYDINRSPDRGRELEEKLARLRSFLSEEADPG